MLIVVAIPVLLVAVPLIVRGAAASYRARVVIVVLLGVLVMLGAMSVGLFFVPTLIAMIVPISFPFFRSRRNGTTFTFQPSGATKLISGPRAGSSA
ncbi:MAG: hypothetical protein ABMA25_22280, partial [Ilumatobacteraceae bacterium]